MEIHNTTEDLVIAEINAICDSLEAGNKQEEICTCYHCRQDAACYVLNRAEPRYVISHRGAARVTQNTEGQTKVDLTALAYEGIKRVGHNQRPYFDHKSSEKKDLSDIPVYNIPTIMGRVFDGQNFSPMADITIELLQNGALVEMKDDNWQNPYFLIAGTGGTFTFWPKAVVAENIDIRETFKYSIRIATPDYAELIHVFTIPVISEKVSQSFSLSRTFTLPDLFLFSPGEEMDQSVIDE
ncbi:MAG: late competence development ComFB family protein [Treponema sp.]|jgi:competence protein ComFB|nr:late competence development ComFB family protein [Treponema sp.]